MENPTAGWYPDSNGAQRYWDGTQWTEQTAPQGNQPTMTETIVAEGTYTAAGPSVQTATFVQRDYHSGHNLDTNRSLVKYILLGLITFGIYPIYITARAGEDLNMIATRSDNKRTMNYWLIALLLSALTAGIMYFVWWHGFANRVGAVQQRFGLRKTVSSADFWLWGVLGTLILVGPFIFAYKWLNAMNEICTAYNRVG